MDIASNGDLSIQARRQNILSSTSTVIFSSVCTQWQSWWCSQNPHMVKWSETFVVIAST